MRKTTVAFAVIAVFGAVLSGCSGSILPESKKIEYKSAGKVPSLEIPPDLTQQGRDDRYAVPDVGAGKGTATYSAYSTERSGQARTSTAQDLLPQVDKMRIERSGTQRWLVAGGTPEALWPTLHAAASAWWVRTGERVGALGAGLFFVPLAVRPSSAGGGRWESWRTAVRFDPTIREVVAGARAAAADALAAAGGENRYRAFATIWNVQWRQVLQRVGVYPPAACEHALFAAHLAAEARARDLRVPVLAPPGGVPYGRLAGRRFAEVPDVAAALLALLATGLLPVDVGAFGLVVGVPTADPWDAP